MKKTMIFENEFDYDNWFEANEEKEGGHDFIEDRVVIVKGTRTIQNRKFNGFSADATINCKNVKTAIRRFIKELKSNGFNVSEDEFESNVHCFTDCGYVVEIEEIDDDRFYINYMCYQNEVEEEATETETTEPETATEIEIAETEPETTEDTADQGETSESVTKQYECENVVQVAHKVADLTNTLCDREAWKGYCDEVKRDGSTWIDYTAFDAGGNEFDVSIFLGYDQQCRHYFVSVDYEKCPVPDMARGA